MGQRTSPSRQLSTRGIGPLIGSGWLREPARPLAQGRGDAPGRSALRKCMFLQVPTDVPQMLPASVGPPLPPPAPRQPEPIVASPRRPEKFAREMPVFPAAAAARLAPRPVPVRQASSAPAQWWEDPIAIGSLLLLVPPVGLSALWSSRRYSSDARWALTVMTALMMCMMTSVAIAIIVLRA